MTGGGLEKVLPKVGKRVERRVGVPSVSLSRHWRKQGPYFATLSPHKSQLPGNYSGSRTLHLAHLTYTGHRRICLVLYSEIPRP